jgi:hypothetical protein
MLNERDATRLWQRLFRGQTITSSTLAEAESLVNQLNPESPLRLRFSTELEEIRTLHQETC